MKSDKVCSPRSPDRNSSEVVGSRVSADLREITITKSRPRWCRTVLEGRQDRETRERGSVSLCSLRSLRASMCQLFKIHKARGECQERTKFNDLHRLAKRRTSIRRESLRSRRASRPVFVGKGQYQGPRRHPLRFCCSVNLRNVTVDFCVCLFSLSNGYLNNGYLKPDTLHFVPYVRKLF